MRTTAIAFPSGKLSLEGIISMPPETTGRVGALLMSHPHPMLGGNMHNPVVAEVCRVATGMGFASLRFNLRGVGQSEGEFDNGTAEQDDVKAALEVMRRWPGVDGKRVSVAGYSFGASVVLNGLKAYKAARCLVFIAPPVSAVRDSAVRRDKRPKLFVAGQHDRLVPSVGLQRALDEMEPSARFAEVPGADHSFQGQERSLAETVVSFLFETSGIRSK
jgi:hypothetical protein